MIKAMKKAYLTLVQTAQFVIMVQKMFQYILQ